MMDMVENVLMYFLFSSEVLVLRRLVVTYLVSVFLFVGIVL